jgi:hypothetical protein
VDSREIAIEESFVIDVVAKNTSFTRLILFCHYSLGDRIDGFPGRNQNLITAEDFRSICDEIRE